ncbi:hypothetical protein KEM54_003604 [Ascosphaera aggregata]|nr:hypothetical protein KEM54_003604 [Ascosphaera aggregata]
MSKPPRLSFAMLPPPGVSLTRPTPEDPNPSSNPQIFNDAMSIRTTVFIDEQHCDPYSELDDDDSRSWHWVFYDENEENGTTTGNGDGPDVDVDVDTPSFQVAKTSNKIPVGVLRLVPPPHEPHAIENARIGIFKEPTTPYIKLGRVALLGEYRGKGLGKFIISTALEWAREHPREITESLRRSAQTAQKKRTSGAGVDGEGWNGLSLVHAQKVMEPMYTRCGFVRDDSMGTWTEEKMVHIGMWQTVVVKGEES